MRDERDAIGRSQGGDFDHFAQAAGPDHVHLQQLLGGRAALLFALYHRHSYTGCKPAYSDLLMGTTALVAALAAQGHGVLEAAQLGVYLHGLAGDLAIRTTGMTALAAGDLVDHLGAAFDRLGRA